MNRKIYGESVQGASHIRNHIVCQDSYKQVQISDDIALIAVADGHGLVKQVLKLPPMYFVM